MSEPTELVVFLVCCVYLIEFFQNQYRRFFEARDKAVFSQQMAQHNSAAEAVAREMARANDLEEEKRKQCPSN